LIFLTKPGRFFQTLILFKLSKNLPGFSESSSQQSKQINPIPFFNFIKLNLPLFKPNIF